MDDDEILTPGTDDAGAPADGALDAGTDNDGGSQPGTDNGPSATDAFLAGITEGETGDDAAQAAARARDAAGRFLPGTAAPTGEELPTGATPPAKAPPASATPPAGQPAQPPAADTRTPEQREQDELLAGIKSDRGRERIRQVFAERAEAQQGLGAIRDMVSAAGLTPDTFGQHIQFAALMNSNNPQDLEQAVGMLEQAREDLYRRLGRDAPGVDGLSDQQDLAQAVAAGQMDRAKALEMASLRRQNAQAQQQQQLQQQQDQETQQFQQAVQKAEGELQRYMASRGNEADARVREKVVKDFFADPVKLQRFAATYRPDQWVEAIKLMYDSVQVAPAAAARREAPLSNRSASLGRPALAPNLSPEDRTMQALEGMGL